MLKNIEKNFNDLNNFRKKLEMSETHCILADKKDIQDWETENGDLVLNYAGKQIPVRETALASILGRYKVNGEAFRSPKMNDAILASVFNDLKNILDDSVKIMVTDGAINSINSKEYSHIPMTDILDESVISIGNFYEGPIKCDITSSYEKTRIKFYTDKRFEFNGLDRKLTIVLSNSENGQGGVRYGAYIGNCLPIMSDINIIHKYKANLDRVSEAVNSLEIVVNQAYEALCLLEDIELKAPCSAARDLAEKAGIPEMYIKDVTNNIKGASSITVFTAAQIYDMYVDAINRLSSSKESSERYKNNVLKLISYKWDKYAL